MRYGFTTGSCAAAAAKAAAYMLLTGKIKNCITIETPKGIPYTAEVTDIVRGESQVSCAVVKDGGDDPDVTNGTDVCVTVAYAKQRVREQIDGSQDRSCAFTSESFPYLTLDGGIGIGRVTKEGLEQAVGQAAINRVPRQMIFAAVIDVCEKANVSEPLHITVWMPEGEALAKRTFNPKLGIEGGLSVLGTSGILEPMSEQALIDTIRTEMKMHLADGEQTLLITPGNYGQDFLHETLKIELKRSIKCSNFIGDTIDMGCELGAKGMLFVGHIGKLVKLGAGIMNTHSKMADGRMEILTACAVRAGADIKTVRDILDCVTTDAALEVLKKNGLLEKTMEQLMLRIDACLQKRGGDSMQIGAVVFSNEYGLLGKTEQADELLLKIGNEE